MLEERGFSLVEMLIVVAVLGVLSALALPSLLRARISSHEASALGSMRSIVSAQSTFESTCGAGGYATDLADLAKPPPSSVEAFLSPDLGANGVQKSGYVFAVEKSAASNTADVALAACNGAGSPRASAFFASATPVSVGVSGVRHFAADTQGTIFQGALPIPNPIPSSAVPVD